MGMNLRVKLASDTILELVCPPDDGRYTGDGSVYLETDMFGSGLASINPDDPLTLYPTQKR